MNSSDTGPNQRVICFNPKPDARLRVFMFPFAGAGANTYRDWDLGEDIELWAVQYPGREWRRQIPLVTTIEELCNDLLPALMHYWPAQQQPVILFGYSMGAIVAHHIAQALKEQGKSVTMLMLAACRAPHILSQVEPIHRMEDEQFVNHLNKLGGMPDAVLKEPALLELALPILRQDFELLIAHKEPERDPLNCPINIYGGTHDSLATRSHLAAWRGYTQSNFSLRLFSGNHFFINSARGQLAATLKADINECLANLGLQTSEPAAQAVSGR